MWCFFMRLWRLPEKSSKEAGFNRRGTERLWAGRMGRTGLGFEEEDEVEPSRSISEFHVFSRDRHRIRRVKRQKGKGQDGEEEDVRRERKRKEGGEGE